MKLLAFTIFDNKALQYHPPFFVSTDGVAVRNLQQLVEDGNTTIGRHPTDYVLYCCGSYDDQNGQMWPEQPLRHVMDAIALVKIQAHLLEADLTQSTAETVAQLRKATK
jgi:hypothetical protein